MRRRASGLLLLWALAACTAQMVEKRPPRKGPVPEVGLIEIGRGEVRYSTEGWAWVVAQRRKTALRQIRKVCKGMQFTIKNEFVREDVEVPYSQSEVVDNLDHGLRHYNVDPFNHVVFECVPNPL